jgi:hypothetical protein
MIKALKRWIVKTASEGWNATAEAPRHRLNEMFMDAGAAMVVFQIDNGYVVRTFNRSVEAITGERSPGFTYCVDHQAIADHIVSSAMRDRLGVQDDPRKQVKVTTRSHPAGLAGASQAVPF